MRFDFIGQQMKDILSYFAGILADMQKIMIVGCKTGYICAVLEYPELAFVFFVMGILAHFKMMHFFIPGHGDRVVFHTYTTN